MNCKRYSNWLTDAALGALPANRQAELDTHLAQCPGCRTSLAREQALQSSITASLAHLADAQPSPSFAASVVVRTANEPLRAPSPFFMRWPVLVGATAACTVLAIAVFLGPGIYRQVFRSTPQPPPYTSTNNAVPSTSPTPVVAPPITPVRSRSHRAQPNRSAEADFLAQVLVPRNQLQAVFHLQQSAKARPLDATWVKPPQVSSAGFPITVSELSVAPLEVQPLNLPAEPGKGSTE